MDQISRKRLEFAAEIFLIKLRQMQVKAGKDGAPSRSLSSYSPENRSALMAAVGAAIRAAGSDFDLNFQNWLVKNAETTHSTSDF